MILGRISLSLLARAFDMSLYVVLHRLIGQKSVIFEGWLDIGMRAILVLLISAIGILEFKTFKTMFVIFKPTMSQYLCKKIADIPFGPGALVGWSCLSAMMTSSLVKVLVSSAFISSVTHLDNAHVTSLILLGEEMEKIFSK